MLRPHRAAYPSEQVFPLGGGGAGSLELPSGAVIPDPVGKFFAQEHQGKDIHPEFRPWALRRVAVIIATAPVEPLAPNILRDGVATQPFAQRSAPIDIAPQIPKGVTF